MSVEEGGDKIVKWIDSPHVIVVLAMHAFGPNTRIANANSLKKLSHMLSDQIGNF